MTEDWFMSHFKDMEVYFGGDPRVIPKDDADFIGFYLQAPESAVTHLGIVERIQRDSDGATFFLKAVVKLDRPIKLDHQVRGHQYKTLEELGVCKLAFLLNDFSRVGGGGI